MATLNKIDVPVAVSHNSKLDLSSTHITSSGFMQLQPCYYYHCIPGTRIQGNINVLSRLAPLQLPTYGRCRINMRYWFVPYRTVMPNWNEFISDTIASDITNSSLVSGTPSISNNVLMTMFLGSTGGSLAIPLSTALTNWQTGDPFDFATGSTHYALTYQGRKYMKVLHSLGYRFTFDGKDTTVYSALGILCYAKVYLDWYTNQQYHNSADYLYIQRLFKFIDPTGSLSLTSTDLSNILWFVQTVCYDAGNDVYVNAWDNPMSPNNGNFSTHVLPDISNYSIGTNPSFSGSAFVNQGGNGTPLMVQNNPSQPYIGSEYIHSTLKAFTDYVKRNALSGADAADRLLSRFGYKLDNAALNRSTFIGESSADVDFGSVMQTVNNAGAGQPSNLGDYAGQGLGRGNGSFDFKCEEFGMFMITYSIVPSAALWQGFDPNNLHIDKLSFFHPEFDNLGCSAIPRGAVYVSKDEVFYTGGSQTLNQLSTFGFAPRFYEYKQKSSYVTGDIESAVLAGGDAWHLNRMFDDSSFGGINDNVVHSFDFTRGVDASTYNRIFNYTGDDIDNFYLVFHIAAQGIAPCRSLFDTYDFDDAGEKLKLSSQGAKVN